MDQPLAERLSPQNLDEFRGRNKVLGERSLLRKYLENDNVPSMYKKPLRYDKSGEEHYNLISPLHKAVRGSIPDVAIYWLHRMLQGAKTCGSYCAG